MAVVAEPGEKGLSQRGVAEEVGPLLVIEIGRDDRGLLAVTLVDELEEDVSIQNLTLYNLIKAYKFAMEHQPKEVVHNITRMNVSIDEQIEFIDSQCSINEYVSFLGMIIGMEKIRVVVTFIAILEMAKNGVIGIKINESLTDFLVFKIAELPEEGIIETSSFN